MNRVKILADENIPDLQHLCKGWGELIEKPGRKICRDDLHDIDILFVRSVTVVDSELLADTPVKFIGSATIGVDHIDISYLQANNIGFSYAPGCNANAVVDYVMSVVLQTFSDDELRNKNFGIVGHGNVGSRLARCLKHFDLSYHCYDPLLSKPVENGVGTLGELMSCDVISLHVPLTRDGKYPSYHLINEDILHRLAEGSLLINTSRGAVVDNDALQRFLTGRRGLSVALDVWESEPDLPASLFNNVAVATPHIAGYSLAGKQRGALSIVASAADYFDLMFERSTIDPAIDIGDYPTLNDYRDGLASTYSANDDAARFRQFFLNSEKSIATAFEQYRKQYPLRGEINYGS